MNQQLLNEYYSIDYNNILIESTGDNQAGEMILKNVILQRADAENQNGRIYPMDILEPEIERYREQHIRSRTSLGELDHTNSDVINLSNACLMVTSIGFNDKKEVVGDIKILTTNSGITLRKLIECGVRVGISSRSLGDVMPSGKNTSVVNNLRIISFDAVCTPSTQGAFINESIQYSHINKLNKFNDLFVDFITEIGK